MSRLAIVLCLMSFVGCSRAPNTDPAVRGSDAEVEDGGAVENADRDKAEAYFVALGRVQTVEEEEQLLTEFGEWLKKNGYRISAVEKEGKHELSCPYFPPVTPWAEHSFLDVTNLDLLPQ